MQADLVGNVHAVLDHGIQLRERLDAGEVVQWVLEQQILKELLTAFKGPADEDQEPDFALELSEETHVTENSGLSRATIRYALTCWLHEWLAPHRDGSLDPDVAASPEAIAKFWDEARYAETRGDVDALEVMHLCVMLGFRGPMRERPDQIEKWANRTRATLNATVAEWATPASLEAPGSSSPRASDLPLRRMTFSVLLTFSLLLPLVLVLLWKR